MTLGELMQWCSENAWFLLLVFIGTPLISWMAGRKALEEPAQRLWMILLGILVYVVAIPAVFAITLNVYLFLFERLSILQTNLATQVLPVISMVATFYLISKSVSLDDVPGFGRISGLLTIIFVLLTTMWILDKTRIIAFTFIPVTYVIGMFVIIFGLLAYGWDRVKGKG